MRLVKRLAWTLGLALFPIWTLQASVVQAAVKTETVRIDPSKATIHWVGKKVTGQHNGTIKLQSGQVTLSGNQVTGGEFIVDMKSLDDSDITDADSKAKLVGHLKSDDFFGVEKFPTAKFMITSVKPVQAKAGDKYTHEITGDLTIKGKTAPVTFPAILTISDKSVQAEAMITVDRTTYDVRYGSGKFFQNLGDKMVYDEFTLQVHLEGFRSVNPTTK